MIATTSTTTPTTPHPGTVARLQSHEPKRSPWGGDGRTWRPPLLAGPSHSPLASRGLRRAVVAAVEGVRDV
jgi:hypothetical protein